LGQPCWHRTLFTHKSSTETESPQATSPPNSDAADRTDLAVLPTTVAAEESMAPALPKLVRPIPESASELARPPQTEVAEDAVALRRFFSLAGCETFRFCWPPDLETPTPPPTDLKGLPRPRVVGGAAAVSGNAKPCGTAGALAFFGGAAAAATPTAGSLLPFALSARA
jgi:hypothetical protein